MESSFAEKDLWILLDKKRKQSQQCLFVLKKANSILGCTRKSIANERWEVILPLCSVLARHVGSTGSSSGLRRTKEPWTH